MYRDGIIGADGKKKENPQCIFDGPWFKRLHNTDDTTMKSLFGNYQELSFKNLKKKSIIKKKSVAFFRKNLTKNPLEALNFFAAFFKVILIEKSTGSLKLFFGIFGSNIIYF